MSHIHEKVDFTVEVFIVYKNKVLLRLHDKYKIWLSVGGHIELDEDPIQAALREAKEEVGLDITIAGEAPAQNESDYKDLIPPKYLSRHRINATHEHVTFVYFATANSDVIAESVNDHEKSETRWVNKNELATMNLRPNVLFYCLKALEELGTGK